jgi:hypothetical protein
MIEPLPREVRRVLSEGSFCYVAARTSRGPHVTPLVYAVTASRLWLTTSRRSVKAHAWKRDPAVAGLVHGEGRTLVFRGRASSYDLLDLGTWIPSLRAAPGISLAAAEFARRNARFFAGYAVDAPRVPLAWSPPGRVFSEIALERAALIEGGSIARWGDVGGPVRSASSFRAMRAGRNPLAGIPPEVSQRLGEGGPATLAMDAPGGMMVLPAVWLLDRGSVYATLPMDALELAGGGPRLLASLVADHASAWRARAMAGIMIRGRATIHVLDRLRSGRSSAGRLLASAGIDPRGAALVALDPERLVWWSGWRTGTVIS